MFELLTPDEYYRNIFEIDIKRLKHNGIRGIICDIDNTIVPYKNKMISDEVREWLDKLRKNDFKICLVSNGLKSRVDYFSNKLDLPAVGKAVKPAKRAYKESIKILDLDKEEIVVVGDQIFTDILGGNRLNLNTILVNPMTEEEFFVTRIMRKIEKCFFKRK